MPSNCRPIIHELIPRVTPSYRLLDSSSMTHESRGLARIRCTFPLSIVLLTSSFASDPGSGTICLLDYAQVFLRVVILVGRGD